MKRKQKTGQSAVRSPAVEEIFWIVKGCQEDRKNLNELLTLLNFCKPDQPAEVLEASIVGSLTLFKSMLKNKEFTLHQTESVVDETTSKQVSQWLLQTFNALVGNIFKVYTEHPTADAQESAFNGLMHILILESMALHAKNPDEVSFPNDHFSQIIIATLETTRNQAVLETLLIQAMNEFDDIRYYGLRDLAKLLEANQISAERMFTILTKLEMPESDEQIRSFFIPTIKQASDPKNRPAVCALYFHRQEFSKCWSILLQNLPDTNAKLLKAILIVLPKRIMSHLLQPVQLMDFFTTAYDRGGLLSLLALDGLFRLIREYNLDYPSFFIKLYALLDERVFHVRYRRCFLKLLGLFMKSTLLPAYLVAAFIKRMARLSLTAPPASILWILPFIYNLLKEHPACMVLIHHSKTSGGDGFNASEVNPARCGALESSLWEVNSLEKHYAGPVARMAALFREKMTKPEFELEDFLDLSYDQMLEEELAHRWSRPPPLQITIDSSTAFSKTTDLFLSIQ